MNVLLIEDSNGDILLIDTAFKQLEVRYNLTVKINGKEAIDYIKDSDLNPEISSLPEMIILDLNLPIINGFDVLIQIKKSKILANVPVIIFSSSEEEIDKIKALKLGAAAYFTKPVDYDEYLKTVETFLSIVDL